MTDPRTPADPSRTHSTHPDSRWHVEPGGPPVTIGLGTRTLTKASVGPMDNNAYIVADADGPVVLVDAAADPGRLTALIAGRTVGAIVTTHQHHDHLTALAEMAQRTGADLVCGTPDREAIEQRTGTRQHGVWDGDVVHCGTIDLSVVGLVGHTEGSIALEVTAPAGADAPVHLLTGDTLFPGGVGRTESPDDFISLWTDVVTKIFEAYDDDTVVHPGHGDSTTLGAERPHLADWRTRGW